MPSDGSTSGTQGKLTGLKAIWYRHINVRLIAGWSWEHADVFIRDKVRTAIFINGARHGVGTETSSAVKKVVVVEVVVLEVLEH